MEIPEVVRNKALAHGAREWLDALPALLTSLEQDWKIRLGEVYAEGTEAYVAMADCADGTAAVLKVMIPRGDRSDPHEPARHEATVLQIAAGSGCPELYRVDVERDALLMERLGPSLRRMNLPIGERHAILCDAARAMWRPASDSGLPTGAEKADWLIEQIEATWEEVGRPCARRTIDHAIECARRRRAAHDDSTAVLVHGDVHQWNALQAGDGFKLIDPDGLLAEPEYDLGIIMREDPVELLDAPDPFERARRIAARTGCDPLAAWEWGVVERVSTGLLCARIDLQPEGAQMLHAADVLATAPPRPT